MTSIPGKKVVHSGEVIIGEQEGGYAGDCVSVGGKFMEELMGELFGIEPNSRGSFAVWPSGERKLPAVRITIEILSD